MRFEFGKQSHSSSITMGSGLDVPIASESIDM